MRTKRKLSAPSAAQVAAGALILAVPASAVALGSGQAGAAQALTASVSRHKVAYGGEVTISGTAPSNDAGRSVELQYLPAGGQNWRSLASTTVGSGDRFSFRTKLDRTGLMRVTASQGLTPADTSARAAAINGTSPASSQASRVAVGARFAIGTPSRDAVAGHPITVRGRLLPGTGGRTVRLMSFSRGHWRMLASTRTGRRGAFRFHYAMPSTGTKWLRVSFAGDRSNRSAWAHAGRVTGFVYTVASWYNDGGNTACGFHATYGVANKSLPCGTKVTFVYGGRSVVATVDDRGPYVGGRSYDLNQNTAGAIGMDGVATVLSST